MSFERSGLPEAVWTPETVQLFEPAVQPSHVGFLRVCWRARGRGEAVSLVTVLPELLGLSGCEFGLGLVEGNIGDVFLGGGEVDRRLGGWMVAPGAHWVEVCHQFGR